MGAPSAALPWRVTANATKYQGGDPVAIETAEGEVVACNTDYYPTGLDPDHAALIVRAVNAHDALLEALECAPIVAAGESLAEFRSRQDAWLNGKYRAAISRALPGGEGK